MKKLVIFVVYSGIKPVCRTTSLRGAKEKSVDCLGNKIIKFEVCGSIMNPQLNPSRAWARSQYGAKDWAECNIEAVMNNKV